MASETPATGLDPDGPGHAGVRVKPSRALVAVHRWSWVPVGLIAGREIVISLYRSWVARAGVSVPARPLAKVKTWVQDLAVGAALLPWTGQRHASLAEMLLWLAVVLTLATGTQYLVEGRRMRLTPGAVMRRERGWAEYSPGSVCRAEKPGCRSCSYPPWHYERRRTGNVPEPRPLPRAAPPAG